MVPFLIQAWICGDKYALLDFQNRIMIELLHTVDDEDGPEVWPDFPMLVEGFEETLPDSPLRKLLAEQLVYGVYGPSKLDQNALDAADGIPGASRAIVKAIDETREMNQDGRWEFPDSWPRWRDFMVGDESNMCQIIHYMDADYCNCPKAKLG